MRAFIFSFALLMFGGLQVHAQAFRVQIAVYNERQPEAFFKERGITHYTESVDDSGIYWYSAGKYTTFEDAEKVHQEVVSKGFIHALIIDEEEQSILAGKGCQYIRDGVVFTPEPNRDSSVHIIYFDFGKSSLNPEAKEELDAVFLKMREVPALTLKLKGFTDGVGDGKDNMKLAAIRSRAARDYLIYRGVRADRMFMEVFGEAEPAAPNAEDDGSNAGKGRDLPDNRKWNRRVVLTLELPNKGAKNSGPNK